MNDISKYLRPWNYIERLQWLKVFSNISNSSFARSAKIHCSSLIQNSKVNSFAVINKRVRVIDSSVGFYCKILDNGYLFKSSLGDYSYINTQTTILRSDIGKYCSIASNVDIGPTSHPMDKISTHPFLFLKDFGNLIKEDDNEVVNSREGSITKLGNDIWIGQGATIMPGLSVGNGAIIGAHSLVTKDVEPYSIVVGLPAKHVRYRFESEIRDKLLKIEWWNWDRLKLKKCIKEFSNIDKFLRNHSG